MSKKQDSRKRAKPKPSLKYGSPGRSFNHLSGENRQWAHSNRFDRAEYCVAVKDGKRYGGSDDTKLKCGDGRSGFSTRRRGQDDSNMEIGLDGQWKKKRGSMVSPKSARCCASRRARRVDGSKCWLISLEDIRLAMRDPKLVRAEEKLSRLLGQPRRQMNRRERRERVKVLSKLKAEVSRWS